MELLLNSSEQWIWILRGWLAHILNDGYILHGSFTTAWENLELTTKPYKDLAFSATKHYFYFQQRTIYSTSPFKDPYELLEKERKWSHILQLQREHYRWALRVHHCRCGKTALTSRIFYLPLKKTYSAVLCFKNADITPDCSSAIVKLVAGFLFMFSICFMKERTHVQGMFVLCSSCPFFWNMDDRTVARVLLWLAPTQRVRCSRSGNIALVHIVKKLRPLQRYGNA